MKGHLIIRALILFCLCLQSILLPAFADTLKVEIKAANSEQEQNIRGTLSISSLDGKEVPSISRVRYLHKKAETEIKKALEPFGFYQVEADISLTESNGLWTAKYNVTPGAPILINQLDLKIEGEALADKAFTQLLQQSPVQEGKVLVHSDYESLKRQLMSLSAERGYHKAQLTEHRIDLDLIQYTAKVVLHFDSGPRFVVSDINFTGSPLREDFLSRYATFQAGDSIETRSLIDLQTALMDSDYFKLVEVRPRWDSADESSVPVDVTLVPQPRTKYTAGLGYGTDTGARTKFGLTRRWVNTRGHQFSSELLASEVTNSLTAEYGIPGENPRKDRYAIYLNFEDENSNTVISQTNAIGASWQKQYDRWQLISAIDYKEEAFELDGVSQQSRFLIPRVSANTFTGKSRLSVDQGYRFSAQLSGASESLLSDTDFIQLSVGGKYIHSLTEKWRVLGRVDAGMTWAGDFNLLPASQRFFAGGDNSVRGYEYESLGPVGSDGDVIGGANLLVASIETDYRLTKDWGVALFMDMGNAFDDIDMELKTGVGFGVRWFLPIGPVRLDFAIPQDNSASDFQIHFSLGADL